MLMCFAHFLIRLLVFFGIDLQGFLYTLGTKFFSVMFSVAIHCLLYSFSEVVENVNKWISWKL